MFLNLLAVDIRRRNKLIKQRIVEIKTNEGKYVSVIDNARSERKTEIAENLTNRKASVNHKNLIYIITNVFDFEDL